MIEKKSALVAAALFVAEFFLFLGFKMFNFSEYFGPVGGLAALPAHLVLIVLLAERVLSLAPQKDRQKILAINIGTWFFLFALIHFNIENYVCTNIDNVVHLRLVRKFAGQSGTNWLDKCEEYSEEFYDDHFFAGFENGSIYNGLEVHKFLGRISQSVGVPAEMIIPYASMLLLFANLILAYVIYGMTTKNHSLLPILSLLWIFENPVYFVRNGWMIQQVLMVLFMSGLAVTIYAFTRAEGMLEMVLPSIATAIIFAWSMNIYNLFYFFTSPDRFIGNWIDMYRVFYSTEFILIPLAANFLMSRNYRND